MAVRHDAVAMNPVQQTSRSKRRQAAAPDNPRDVVFPTRNGTWQQVNNVERRRRQVRKDTGLEWVTPHTFPKTLATLVSARVDADTASQQLGHSSPAITRERWPEHVGNTWGPAPSGSHDKPPRTCVSAGQRRLFGRADRI
jgi:integrase